MRFPEIPSGGERPLPPGVKTVLEAIHLRDDLEYIGGLPPEAYYHEMAHNKPYPELSRKLVGYAIKHNVLLRDETPAYEAVLRIASDDEQPETAHLL